MVSHWERTAAVCFEKFATTTVLRIFNFIRTSTFLVERLFWIAVLIGFSLMTVSGVAETIQTFIAEPTISHVAYVNNATTGLAFPKATICVEINSHALLKLFDEKVDDVIADVLSASNFTHSLHEKVRKINLIEDERIKSASQWMAAAHNESERVIGMGAYHTFKLSNREVFSENEVALVGLTTAMFVRLLDIELNPAPAHVEWQSASLQKLYRAFVRKEANFSELLDLTGVMICTLLQIRLSTYRMHPFTGSKPSMEAYNFCKLLSIYGLGPSFIERGIDMICYGLSRTPDAPIAFQSTLDYVVLTMHAEALYGVYASALESIVFDFGGKMAYHSNHLLEVRPFCAKQVVEFSLETISRMAALRRSSCMEDGADDASGTWLQCQLWCRAESIRRACNCAPLMRQFVLRFGNVPDDSPSCVLSSFSESGTFANEACHVTLTSDYDLENCSQRCYAGDCETFIFDYAVHADGPLVNHVNATTVLKLAVTKFIYQTVDEYLMMTSKSLLAALGGSLSLYLGASFLALIHIVVFAVKMPFEFLRKPETCEPAVATAAVSTAELASSMERIEGALTVMNDDVSSLREYVKSNDRRLEMLELDRKLRPRGALVLKSTEQSVNTRF